MRTCRGCDTQIVPGERERNKRVWCSEACRTRHRRAVNPEYRLRDVEQTKARYHENFVPTRPGEHTCWLCGETFFGNKRSESRRKYCSPRCRNHAVTRIRRARLAGAESGPYTRADLVARDGTGCHLCSKPVDLTLRYPERMAWSFDHVIPLSKGGSDMIDNMALAHWICNITKHARLLELRR